MSKAINRIITLIKALDISARQFDMSIGTANGYTLRMQKNNASVGSDVIERIIKEYPQVNLVWLITGQGEMFIPKESTPKVRSKQEIDAYIHDRITKQLSEDKQRLLKEILDEIDAIEANNRQD